MATRDDEKLVIDYDWWMEPPGTGMTFVFGDWGLFPAHGYEIEDPEVIEVGYSFSSENY